MHDDEVYNPLWKERVVFRESSAEVLALTSSSKPVVTLRVPRISTPFEMGWFAS